MCVPAHHILPIRGTATVQYEGRREREAAVDSGSGARTNHKKEGSNRELDYDVRLRHSVGSVAGYGRTRPDGHGGGLRHAGYRARVSGCASRDG